MAYGVSNEIDILYQDNRILVCIKPYGVLSTDAPGGLPGLLRDQLGDAKACVRTVHRLDQVVGGVMVLARSREASRRLSAQMQERQFHKEYLAVVHGKPSQPQGQFRDLLLRNKSERKTYVVGVPGKDVQEAILSYRVLAAQDGLSLICVQLETGRTHQIRAQFSAHGYPIWGDKKYDAEESGENRIALWSHRLVFVHPQTNKEMEFSASPPKLFPWTQFYGETT